MAKKKPRPPLSEQFREYVRNCGQRPADLGRQAGISRSLFSQFLNGSKFLGTEKMDSLADVLGLELTRKEVRRGKS